MTPSNPAPPSPPIPSADPRIETFTLGPFVAPRIWNGLWQLASSAWGSALDHEILRGMAGYVEKGFNAFADHYGAAEIYYGRLLKSLENGSIKLSDPSKHRNYVIGATKWCVFENIEPTWAAVEAGVRDRLKRMKVDRIDLLQFHWKHYSNPGYLVALEHIQRFKDQGLISAVGLCNFDVRRTDEICTQLGPGFIVSNQVQFSLIDTRPLHGMADLCERHNIKLLTYGTLCGGLLSEKWLGKEAPDPYRDSSITPSLRKYLDVIEKAWGNWALFQSLLRVLEKIGKRHERTISHVATRWVLDHPFVGAVLIGARMGISDHSEDNLKAFGFNLTEEDKREIDAVLQQSKESQQIAIMGDCGDEYRGEPEPNAQHLVKILP